MWTLTLLIFSTTKLLNVAASDVWHHAHQPLQTDRSDVVSSQVLLPFETIDGLDTFEKAITNRALERFDLDSEPTEKLFNEEWSRILAEGDFDDLNEIIKGATIEIPDLNFTVGFRLTNIDVRLQELTCTNFAIADIELTSTKTSNQEIDVTLKNTGLQIDCYFDWWYEYRLFRRQFSESGQGKAEIRKSDLKTVITFNSTDFTRNPPSGAYVKSCEPNIVVDKLDLGDGVADVILSVFDGAVRRRMKSKIEEVICDKLDALGTAFSNMTERLSNILEGYTSYNTSDPLSAQNSLEVPDGVRLIDFTDVGTGWGKFLEILQNQISTRFGGLVEDPTGPTGEMDLGINVALRSLFLDEDRSFTMPMNDRVIFDGSNVMMNTTMVLTAIRIFGLDTFSHFDLIEPIASQTLQSDFEWREMRVEMDMTLEMTPSSPSSSDEPQIVENITMATSFEEINATLAFFVALDEEQLVGIELGSILQMSQIVSCIFSALHTEMSVTQFLAATSIINPPAITGFQSVGIGGIASNATQVAFDMYEQVLLEAIPGISDVTARSILNNIIKKYLETTSCPTSAEASKEGYVDFRNLFLNETEAAENGASGNSPYGNMMMRAKQLIDETLIAPDPSTGIPGINNVVIGPMTKAQSNISGTVLFPNVSYGQVIEPEMDAIDRIEFRASNVRMENLDSVGYPLKLVEPTSANILDNSLTLGAVSKPLQSSVRLSFSIQSKFLNMQDELDMKMETESAEMFASIMAMMSARSLMEFPLGDVLNPFCWLATIPAPQLNEAGLRVDSDPTLAIAKLIMSFARTQLDVECVSCNSPGMQEVSNIIATLDDAIKEINERLVNYFVYLLESDFTQVYVDRMLNFVATRCPHHPTYNDATNVTKYDPPGFEFLTAESLELLFLSAMVLTKTAVVVATINFNSMNLTTSDPLSAQNELDISTDVQLLNLTEGLFATVLNGAIAQLGEMVATSSGMDLEINRLMRSMLLDETGTYVFPLFDSPIDRGDTMISVEKIKITGLDTFTRFDALTAIAPQTLKSHFQMMNLEVELEIALKVPGSDVVKSVIVKSGLKNIEVTAAFLLAIDLSKLGATELGSLLFSENMFPCFLSTLHTNLNVTHLSVSAGKIDSFTVTGISEALDDIIVNTTTAIHNEYGSDLQQALPLVMDTAVRYLINEALQFSGNKTCPESTMLEGSFVDLRDLLLNSTDARKAGGSGSSPYGDVAHRAKRLFDEMLLGLDPNTGMSNINKFMIGPITKAQSNITGTLKKDELYRQVGKIVVLGIRKYEIRISNVRLDDLDSVGYPLTVMNPTDAHVAENTMTFGAGSKPLHAEARVLIVIEGIGISMDNEFEITMDMKLVQLFADIMAKIDSDSLLKFPLRDIANPHCWLATIPNPSSDDEILKISDVSVSISQARLDTACMPCSSPSLQDLSITLDSTNPSETFTNFLNETITRGLSVLEDRFLQDRINRLVLTAKTKCPHHPAYGTEPNFSAEQSKLTYSAPVVQALIIFGSIVSISIAVFIVVKCLKKWMTQRWRKSLSEEQLGQVKEDKLRQKQRGLLMNKRSKSMVHSEVIPLAVRILIPVIVIANIALFLSGHLSLGGVVSIHIVLMGETVTEMRNFFEFSMAQSAIDLWKAGAKSLAMLILIFSGIWPYTKQLITLALWFIPPSWVSVNLRGSIFVWLDALAKWSMVDIFVLVISLVAFRLSIQPPDASFLGTEFYSAEMMVIPVWGLYANLLAQLISQISSHFIIYYHRKVVISVGTEEKNENSPISSSFGAPQDGGINQVSDISQSSSGRSLSLGKRVFTMRDKRAKMHPYVDYAIILLSVITATLFVLGCALPSFGLDIYGVIGVVDEREGDDQSTSQYSVFSIVKIIMDQARYLNEAPSYIGLGLLCSIFIITALITPLLQVIVVLVVWFVPLAEHHLTYFFDVLEVLKAWQYCEVYIFSVLVTLMQIGSTSDVMFNESCRSLDSMFGFMVDLGLIEAKDAQCFYLFPELKTGFYILLVASAMLLVLTFFVVKVAKVVVMGQKEMEMQNKSILRSEVQIEHGIPVEGAGEGFEDAVAIPPNPKYSMTFKKLLIELPLTPNYNAVSNKAKCESN